jgi:acyl-CoA thioesterase FadM
MELEDSGVIILNRYPSFEGANIATGLGFKHIMYLAEDGVVHYFRERGWGPQMLYENYGLGLEIVHADARLLTGINLDDLVRIEVRPITLPTDPELSFSIQMFVNRAGREAKAVSGTWKVLLRQEEPVSSIANPPSALARFVTEKIERGALVQLSFAQSSREQGESEFASKMGGLLLQEKNAFLWKRRIPYFYCHYNRRLQHSGYLRLLEEVVSLFLEDRGISIRTMLDTKGWIPIVTNTQIDILREGYVEEEIYIVFTIENIFKTFTYTARVDFYVLRGTELLLVGTGKITHGYLKIKGRRDWELARLDDRTLATLSRRGAID